jgi:hypothetical protein
MAAESFFNKITNDVLQATEEIATRLEEGVSLLMTGNLPDSAGSQPVNSDYQPESEFGDLSEEEINQLSEEEIQELLQNEVMENSPLEGIAEGVMDDIMKNQAVGPSTPMQHFQAFKAAITWTETFIQCLVAFQIFMFFLCLWVSRKDRGLTFRVTVMTFIGILVRSAEWLNNFGAKNWKKYCTQNYFDKKGSFIAIMFCGPLLLDCLMMLLFFVKEAGQLLIVVKKGEIRQKKGNQNKKKNLKENLKKKSSKKDN